MIRLCSLIKWIIVVSIAVTVCVPLYSQPTLYDESKVPEYTLPSALVMADGREVSTPQQWLSERRPELMEMFMREVYGYAPGRQKGQHYKVLSVDKNAMGGKATRKEIAVYFSKSEEYYMTLLMYVPNVLQKPAPAFLGINFRGNHTTVYDEEVSLPTLDQINWYGDGYVFYERGFDAHRWPVEYLIDNGYASITFCMSDVDPDWYDGFKNGVHGLFDKNERTDSSWGAIAAWAWGLSRAMDYIETDHDIDSSRIAVHGHSRLAKTALWAGATDPRFAVVIANNAGCTGAAISRRKYGETVSKIQKTFPHWFCRNYLKYSNKEEELPFDQHELLAMIAPRPVYTASAILDKWGDPKGEFLGIVNASAVYELFGFKGVEGDELPPLEKMVSGDRQGYHVRHGGHDMLLYDWEQFVTFTDRFFRPVPKNLSKDESVAYEMLAERYPSADISIITTTPMELYSTNEELCGALINAEHILDSLKTLLNDCEKGISVDGERVSHLRMSAHTDRDNVLWNLSLTPTQSLGVNNPSYPRKWYHHALKVEYEINGYPGVDFIFFDQKNPYRPIYTKSDLAGKWRKYIMTQEDIDRIYRVIMTTCQSPTVH